MNSDDPKSEIDLQRVGVVISRLQRVLVSDDLPEGLSMKEVLFAATEFYTHVHLFLLSKEGEGLRGITSERLDGAAQFFREMLGATLQGRLAEMNNNTH